MHTSFSVAQPKAITVDPNTVRAEPFLTLVACGAVHVATIAHSAAALRVAAHSLLHIVTTHADVLAA
jgi:hypothetical protein